MRSKDLVKPLSKRASLKQQNFNQADEGQSKNKLCETGEDNRCNEYYVLIT